MSGEFDPTSDWPPEGALVQMAGSTVATFREDPMPGWWLTDGRYCRPFDSTGLLLAQRWAANPATAAAPTTQPRTPAGSTEEATS